MKFSGSRKKEGRSSARVERKNRAATKPTKSLVV